MYHTGVRSTGSRQHARTSNGCTRPRLAPPNPSPRGGSSPMEGQVGEVPYPVQFSVEYPDRDLDRLTTAFRLIVAIPIVIVAGTLGNEWGNYRGGGGYVAAGGGVLVLGPLLMILFRQKYPRWWYDWNLQLMRFTNRIGVYIALMDDQYPSTDEEQSVRLDFPYPDAKQNLNRWLP